MPTYKINRPPTFGTLRFARRCDILPPETAVRKPPSQHLPMRRNGAGAARSGGRVLRPLGPIRVSARRGRLTDAMK